MIIFQYCGGVYNIFRTFSGLNKRLNSILVDRRLHLFTDFLCMHHSNTNLDYYYNSALFHDVSQQLLSLTKTENDKKLRQCFQSLVFFHIKVHANQLKHEFQSNMKHFQSIRLLLTNEETQYVDEELKNSLNKLKTCPKSVKNIEKIISLVLKQGARLQYDDNESHEFNLTKSINELLLSKLNSIECCTRQLINALVQMFKSLIISNPSFLKDHDWFYYDSYGSQKSGVDVNKLFELNIRYVLILGKGMKKNFDQIIYKTIEIDDSLEQNISNYIKEALDFIAESQKNDSNILVHCVSGISRSASIVIAYIMDKYKINYDEAFSYVKTKRSTIRPNTNFVEQLNNLQ
ncbi:unnamed protein product [Rotaria sp. Silwood1]|nr:unnamed protein product [Rotaria sp. Silwood1]CAF0770087.1 unnamed protein product [Rotaria sp. Silwood1]